LAVDFKGNTTGRFSDGIPIYNETPSWILFE